MQRSFILLTVWALAFNSAAAPAAQRLDSTTLVFSRRHHELVGVQVLHSPRLYQLVLCNFTDIQDPMSLDSLGDEQCLPLTARAWAKRDLADFMERLSIRFERNQGFTDFGRFLSVNLAGSVVFPTAGTMYGHVKNDAIDGGWKRIFSMSEARKTYRMGGLKALFEHHPTWIEIAVGVVLAHLLTELFIGLMNRGKSYDAIVAALSNPHNKSQKGIDITEKTWPLFMRKLNESLHDFNHAGSLTEAAYEMMEVGG